jgi:hypothetical protein
MAEHKLPLLMNGLTLPEKIMLAGLRRHVGFPVLVKLITALCEESTANVVKLDPEKDPANYEKLLAIRHQESRTTHENARYLELSIEHHIQSAGQQAAEDLDNQLQLGE